MSSIMLLQEDKKKKKKKNPQFLPQFSTDENPDNNWRVSKHQIQF